MRDTYVKIATGESPNDRNDRAIRVATQWYQNHLGAGVRVLLITNDRENKRKAINDDILAETVESYVKSLGQPALRDLIVQSPSEDVTMEDVEDLRPSKRKTIYPERCEVHNSGEWCLYKALGIGNSMNLDNVSTRHVARDKWKIYCSPSSYSSEHYEVSPDNLWEILERKNCKDWQ